MLYVFYIYIYKKGNKREQNAMKELAKRKDIIITNADKGGAVVIMDVEKYINKANRQLSDKRNYEMLQEDPTLQHSNFVNNSNLVNDRFKKANQFSKKLAERHPLIPKPQSFTFHPR